MTIESKKPLVSIALCSYNGEKYLSEQLNSILSQTYQNIEVIIVDDCSNDNTKVLIQSFLKKDFRIKFFENEINLGYIKNFEKAIQLCNGDYIALADQDDIWALNKIEILINHIGNNTLIYHDSEFIEENGSTLNRYISDYLNFISGENKNTSFLITNCISGHALMFRKELRNYFLPFSTNIPHDWWIAFCASSIGSIDFVKNPLVKYRQHDTNQTDFLKDSKNKNHYSSKKRKKIMHVLRKKKLLQQLHDFHSAQFLNNKDKQNIESIISSYNSSIYKFYSFNLLFNLLKNMGMFSMSKNSFLSKLNSIRKEAAGLPLKKRKFHN